MTTSTLVEASKRKAARAQIKRLTFTEDLRLALEAQRKSEGELSWPSPKYRNDPIGFFRDILGFVAWEKQADLLNMIRDNDRVACKSGRRVSKSHSIAGVALWLYCSFPDMRVIITAPTARQVDKIIWREVQMMWARSGRCFDCKQEDPDQKTIPTPCPHSAVIGGEIGTMARTGLKPGREGDYREIVGFTASEGEAIQGIAGSDIAFLADEASGIPQFIFDAIEGNRAGGGKLVLTGNPTKNQGEFYDAFFTKKATDKRPTGYATLSISSEESPNVVAGKKLIKGLATREWVAERKEEWGEKSAMYMIHILGEFAINEDGRVFSIGAISEAEQRWHEMKDPDDRLFIGLDPAGDSGTGDETCFAFRRGKKLIGLHTAQGLTEEAHLVRLLGHINTHKKERERAVVLVDREGAVGARVFGMLRDFSERNPKAFQLVGVRASDKARNQPKIFDRLRDELCHNLELWMREGGAIPEDVKLSTELHTLEWEQKIDGRMKVTPKREIRKRIGRSPDRYDAVALACWEPLYIRDPRAAAAADPEHTPVEETSAARRFDPYAGAFKRR